MPGESLPGITTSASNYHQRYDGSGYPENPESRALSRQSRRAQNDVLATVGVCVGVNADGQPIESQLDSKRKPALDQNRLDAIVRENEIGLLVSSADTTLVSLASLYAVGLRHRLQVSHTLLRLLDPCS